MLRRVNLVSRRGKSCAQWMSQFSTRNEFKNLTIDDDAVWKETERLEGRKISFVTDIEGDGAYFRRFVERSEILEFQNRNPCFKNEDSLTYFPYEEHVIFKSSSQVGDQSYCPVLVVGGDIWDKGGSDLYVMRQLLSLQERYGKNRVFFIMGNRDINKMRIIQEMGDSKCGETNLPYHGGVYWFKDSESKGDTLKVAVNQPNVNDALVPDTPADRLKWIFERTMGSPDAFELRRKELKSEKIYRARHYPYTDSISLEVCDDEVVSSYRTSCHPEKGLMGKYMSGAHLILRIGGALFMHGALPVTSIILSKFKNMRADKETKKRFWLDYFRVALPFYKEGKVPVIDDFNGWVDNLNAFAQRQVTAWSKQTHQEAKVGDVWSTHGGYQYDHDGSDSFGSLNQYGMGWLPNGNTNPTVVYGSWLEDGKPIQFSGINDTDFTYQQMLSEFFDVVDVDVIVTGHQPVGDHPLPIQINKKVPGKTKKFIISADSSFSGDTVWVEGIDGEKRCNKGRGRGHSGRGDFAVAEVVLEQSSNSKGGIDGIRIQGVLSDGTLYESIDFMGDSEDTAIIGTPADSNIFMFSNCAQNIADDDETDWFVKSKFTNGSFLLSSTKGWKVLNTIAKRKIERLK